MYEYVPDSEEIGSTSQAESVISTSSVDEVEFQKKTQRFLENMENLRKEIQEDITETEYQEEIVEELEIEEQGYEETIQMADVKWQFQKKALTEQMRISPDKTFEVIAAFRPEMPQEEEIHVETATAVMSKKRLSQVKPIQQQVSEEATQELFATGADTMEHKDVEIELARHRVEMPTETMVEAVTEDVPVDAPQEIVQEEFIESEHSEIAHAAIALA